MLEIAIRKVDGTTEHTEINKDAIEAFRRKMDLDATVSTWTVIC